MSDRRDTERTTQKTEPGATKSEGKANPRSSSLQTPSWDWEGSVVTSAPRPDNLAGDREPRPGPAGGEALSHERAREVLKARFSAAGFILMPAYTFQYTDLVVTLDAFDPERGVGYVFLAEEESAVSDFDEAAEVAFEQLARDGEAYVLVLHDSDVPTLDALERCIDAFLDKMYSSLEDTL